jgi:hypothetical protein
MSLTEQPRQRRRQVPVVVGACVVVALLVGAVVVFWPNDDESSTAATPNHYHDIGHGVSVTDGAPNAKAVVEHKAKPPFKKAVEPLGHVIEITGGQPTEQVTLRFKLNRKVMDKTNVLFATSETGKEGTWKLVRATAISEDGRYAYVTTDHFSFWQSLWWDVNDAIDSALSELRKGLDALTGDVTAEAKQPKCDGEPEVRDRGYSTRSWGDSLYWCLGLDDNEPVLKIVNKRRYPLLINHPGLSQTYNSMTLFDSRWLARALAGHDKSTLFPFDGEEFHLNLRDGQGIGVSAELDGQAQSLYQLEFGVTTLLNILTRFGAGGGIVSNGRITLSEFDRVAEVMDEFMGIKACANVVLGEFDAGAIGSFLSSCFSPDKLMQVFGWKGFLLAPVMLAGSVVNFFRSECNSLGDLLNGRDEYAIVVKHSDPGPLAPYVGRWHGYNGELLVIKADGTAERSWVEGLCLDSGGPMCITRATVKVTVNEDGSLTGTYTDVRYETEWGTAPPPGFSPPDYSIVGGQFHLTPRDEHMLTSQEDFVFLCDEYALQHSSDPEYDYLECRPT